MKFTFWRKKTVIELLKQHLILMTHDEKIQHLKAIIPLVCDGCHVSKNPTTKEGMRHATKN